MARFYGKIGFADPVDSTGLGDYVDEITERPYFGDITRMSSSLTENGNLNKDIRSGNLISVIADPYVEEHFHEIRYVIWSGTRWTPQDVTVQRPRLIIRLGGVYNGPTPQ